uniref:Candidate secreted effector n=1 Tax=Meloidogyne incognita TaxID=6306 RepID=A0A914NE06_MELIC
MKIFISSLFQLSRCKCWGYTIANTSPIVSLDYRDHASKQAFLNYFFILSIWKALNELFI